MPGIRYSIVYVEVYGGFAKTLNLNNQIIQIVLLFVKSKGNLLKLSESLKILQLIQFTHCMHVLYYSIGVRVVNCKVDMERYSYTSQVAVQLPAIVIITMIL